MPEKERKPVASADIPEAVAVPMAPIEPAPPAGGPAPDVTRQKLSQALQSHNDCVLRVQSGRNVPADCHMTGLRTQPPLGPKPDPDFQAAAARIDYEQKYRAAPGNTDYWKRVGGVPVDGDLHHCSARPGTYSNAKDQRVARCWAPDPINGVGTP